MSSSSSVRINTYAHSATYLSDQLMVSLKRIIYYAELDLEKLMGQWTTTELGIRTWIQSKHLESVHLEIYDPMTDKLVTRWDLDIEFSDTLGDGSFWADTDALKFNIRKCGVIPSSCKYRVIVSTKNGRPDVAGWSSCTFRSTDGLTRRVVGTTIDAGAAGASAAYWS